MTTAARSFPLPDAALAQHVIILGKTRSGKSSTMRLIVEKLLGEAKPVCIVDPKGDWWGLKSSADGKSPGFAVIIFGGEHADVPIAAHAGAYVGELVATGNRPCVIDLGGWTVADRTRFFIDFAQALFRHTRGPRWLCVDEVHNFAPQGKVMDPQAGMMLHWANRLASEGAGKGVTLISASQRPQKVHKDFVTSHETLIAMRVIHPLDRRADEDWISGCPDASKGKEVLTTLAGLKRGQGWVWSPEIGFGPACIQFPLFATYDSFAAPTGEVAAKLKGWAAVDLDDVKAKLASVVEEAKANDPRELRAEIARLKSAGETLRGSGDAALRDEVARLGEAIAGVRQQSAEASRHAWARGYEAGTRDARDVYAGVIDRNMATARLLHDNLAVLEEGMREAADAARPPIAVPADAQELGAVDAPAAKVQRVLAAAEYAAAKRAFVAPPPIVDRRTSRPFSPGRPGVKDAAAPLGPERRILAALAQAFPSGMTEAQWAIAAGMRRSGGTWGTYKSRLRVAGLIECLDRGAGQANPNGAWRATEAGLAALGDAPPQLPPPGRELVEFWAARVAAAGPMLRVLAARFPDEVARANLATALDMTPSGGTFGTYLSRLRTAGLLDESGYGVRAAPELMGKK